MAKLIDFGMFGKWSKDTLGQYTYDSFYDKFIFHKYPPRPTLNENSNLTTKRHRLSGSEYLIFNRHWSGSDIGGALTSYILKVIDYSKEVDKFYEDKHKVWDNKKYFKKDD